MRNELRIKCKEAQNKNWEEKIKHVIDYSKDSKDFWRRINILKGSNTTHTNYMKDMEANKHYSDQEKCALMEKKTWGNIFKVTKEDEVNFDLPHTDHINAIINVQSNRLKSFDIVDMNRLNTENYHTREIATEEIRGCIKKF